MRHVKAGNKAPDFSGKDQNGNIHRISDHKGTWVLLYFYPKDDTPGCTKEACSIRDTHKTFKEKNVVVLRVSKDSVESHKKFADKYTLPFTLIADPEKIIVKRYGVWKKKKFLGRAYMGTARESFLINPKGVIAKVYEKVKPAEHADEVLVDVNTLA
ncbi:MAG: hypothetical protein A3C80_03275 [Candidatus Ryanbacteria bacterium RIFCSPHIGHO2_02_FULL_45_43]|uniref:thioredoxin-dependent peroxiredoxin n=1 Tax=Candidatus Ryanbacteria bacterium RIFCSPHIGHO2_01_45_13 TaxID=1802112 RepID=A0A1G2FTB8_9BACT|nr:MAG: hypothetical protein A2W41_01215 [Candidatus Ryanbacteria bacterium RIFCSPHIGHO2_01_45_13]OGZ41486.1 MAG: hypothetical protein A2718_03540 [Candidatus Ryanbacteria bacterium RIFCSPHIGHO2_01_FULL_44_130]OGZ47953.1 MAG: hypothetical protein A3C80_03275 [Candidatus Ryanbacteria bacterium RIFCSPHIGHO2_02_FULL_45_43]OGZ50089.1 MAG: hypothetical protein A3E55_01140 [Candidatus Ryanbacteria bacterium RIFCSPHIGHO2_12_FULL_44_20]OGZ51091.1 MAG: hypothetical protein A3A17_03580 [Candidatus Ryanba